MKLSDFETPIILALIMLVTYLVARVMERYMNRPGAKDSYTIKDKAGNKLRLEILRSATEDERRSIFEEKTKEFNAMVAGRKDA